MPKIDYGQVPAISPDFKNVELIHWYKKPSDNIHCKYIKNNFLNSSYKKRDGFSLVGKSPVTGKWRILRIWGFVDAS
jgi:hypothetical protein